VVEHASTDEVFTQPRHDYTRQLLAAIPRGVPGRNGAYGERS
jgi:peptide/nickel transport system ATP-binding protein